MVRGRICKPPRFLNALSGELKGLGIVNIGSLIIRIGFGGPLCYNYNKEPPK